MPRKALSDKTKIKYLLQDLQFAKEQLEELRSRHHELQQDMQRREAARDRAYEEMARNQKIAEFCLMMLQAVTKQLRVHPLVDPPKI